MVTVFELYANYPSIKAGIPTYMHALEQLFKNDNDVRVLPVEDLEVKEIPLLKFAYPNKVLNTAIEQANPDWIHINGYTSFATFQSILAAARHHKKILYTAHWHPFKYMRHPISARLFFNFLIKPVVRRYADAIITINDEDFAFFKSISSKVYKIPHWYRDVPNPRWTAEKKKNMILFVGRVDDPVKGIEHIYSIPEGEYDIHCVGTGFMETRRDIHKHVNISNEELSRLYSEASLLVVPSKYEAFSYAALEALLSGTPVLASERVRIGDYLKGLCGYEIFNYGDYEGFHNKIKETINHKVDVDKVLSLFSPNIIKKQYKDVLL